MKLRSGGKVRHAVGWVGLSCMVLFSADVLSSQAQRDHRLEGKVLQLEDWARKTGVYDNYQKFLKQYVTEERYRKLYPKAPAGQIAELLSRGRQHALRMALVYTPEQVVELERKGARPIFHFIDMPLGSTFQALAARSEAVVVGEVVGGEVSGGPDGLRSNVLIVVKEVLSGQSKVGETIRVRQYAGVGESTTIDWIGFNEVGKVYYTNPHRRGVLFLVQKSAPYFWRGNQTIESLMPNGSYMYTGLVQLDGDKLIGGIADESGIHSLVELRKALTSKRR